MAGKNDGDGPLKKQYADIASKRLVPSAEAIGYVQEEIRNVPEGAVKMGLGCGNPTALAELQNGQAVLDLGSGAGLDAFIAAQKVGPRGKVIGIDMTEQMVQKANRFVREGEYENVEFRVGRIECLPVADASIDVIISNCVINHSRDKRAVFQEALRVLRPGGVLLVCDLTVEGALPSPDSPGLEVWKEWLKVARGKGEYLAAAADAGFSEIVVVSECPYTGAAMAESLMGKILSLQLRLRK